MGVSNMTSALGGTSSNMINMRPQTPKIYNLWNIQIWTMSIQYQTI